MTTQLPQTPAWTLEFFEHDADTMFETLGLFPKEHLEQIRQLMLECIAEEMAHEGDTEILRLLATMLFHVGEWKDIFLIWSAKSASFDAHHSIDGYFLLGKGYNETLTYLHSLDYADHPSTPYILEYLDGFEEWFGRMDALKIDDLKKIHLDYWNS